MCLFKQGCLPLASLVGSVNCSWNEKAKFCMVGPMSLNV